VWSAILLAAPFAVREGGGISTAAALVYQGASRICHQRPERSFHEAGVQLPVCARCSGLYLAGAIGALAAWTVRRHPAPRATRTAIVVSAIPTVVTVILELAGIAHPSNSARAFAALPLGATAGWIFVRSLRAEADV
jgi:uncharacterized membrane protein